MNKADKFLKTLIKCRYLEHLFGTKVKFQQEIEEYLAQPKAKNLPDTNTMHQHKEIIIKHIRQRIINEHRKHKDLDWEEIAARKIYSMISDEFVPKSETDVISSLPRDYFKDFIIGVNIIPYSTEDLLLTAYRMGEDNIDNDGNKIDEKGADKAIKMIMQMSYK